MESGDAVRFLSLARIGAGVTTTPARTRPGKALSRPHSGDEQRMFTRADMGTRARSPAVRMTILVRNSPFPASTAPKTGASRPDGADLIPNNTASALD